MKIAFDTNPLYTSQAGVARYVRGLLSALRATDPDIPALELAWPVRNLSYRQPARAVKTAYRELVWTRFLAPAIIRSGKCDLLHQTSTFRLGGPSTVPHIVTLYDLAVLEYPNRFRRWQRRSVRGYLNDVAAADRVICISRFVADEAVRHLGVPAKKLEVVHCASSFLESIGGQGATLPFDVPDEFFLFVGSLEPGKNLALLRESYALAKDREISLPPLLVVGARWQGVATEGIAPDEWVYLDRQPDSVLAELYRRATALLFPSKYEGFGLPVIEAMSLGCPVVCSPVASLPEVAGEAAVLVDLDAGAYLEAMSSILNSGELRTSLIHKGSEQAKKFSWAKSAMHTVEIYRDLLRTR